MARYAAGTDVPADRSIQEIRNLLMRAGATHYAFGEEPERAMIQFALNGRHYRFEVRRPTAEKIAGLYAARPAGNDWRPRIEAEWRRRWRARLLWVKAQIEFAEFEPEAFQEAMLSYLVLPDGRTMGGWSGPQIDAMYADGTMPPLLGSGESSR